MPSKSAAAGELLALTDRFYRAGSDRSALASCLGELAVVLGARSCRLLADGRREVAASPSAGYDLPPAEKSTEVAVDGAIRLVIEAPGGLDAGRREIASAFAPHIARALATGGAQEGARFSAIALDHLAIGVLMLDGGGRLLHANRAGHRILESGEGILETEGMIQVAHSDVATILADLRARDTGGRRSRPSVRISIQRGERAPLEIFAVSIEELGGELGLEAEAALALFVSDPESGLEPPPSVLREHYGLSRREAEVVGQILLGRSLDEAATALGIHRETIRMHLKQVFRKVGTRRQVDLVRLLLTGVPRLRWE